MHKVGIPILAGTDGIGEIPMIIDIPHGRGLHTELELLVEAGLTPAEAIRAATVVPAERHELHDRGTIEPGKRADLVLLKHDPLVNISNTRSIVRIWVGGIEVQSIGKW
jgi:imidazolonepropionase-like amidohydrolase